MKYVLRTRPVPAMLQASNVVGHGMVPNGESKVVTSTSPVRKTLDVSSPSVGVERIKIRIRTYPEGQPSPRFPVGMFGEA